MADIKKELNQIKTAIYGKDVRGSIHDGIDKINKESEDSKQKANEAHDVMESIINDGFDNAALEANFEQKLDDEIGRLQPEWTQFKNDTEQNFNSVTSQLNDVENKLKGPYLRDGEVVTPNFNRPFSVVKTGKRRFKHNATPFNQVDFKDATEIYISRIASQATGLSALYPITLRRFKSNYDSGEYGDSKKFILNVLDNVFFDTGSLGLSNIDADILIRSSSPVGFTWFGRIKRPTGTGGTSSWINDSGVFKTTQVTEHNVLEIVDIVNVDTFGMPRPYNEVDSLAECQSQIGSFYQQGSDVYCNPYKENYIDDCNLLVSTKLVDTVGYDGQNLIFQNIGFLTHSNNFNFTKNQPNVFFFNCRFQRGTQDAFSIKGRYTAYLLDCVAAHASKDGFNYHAATTNSQAIEINGISYGNGKYKMKGGNTTTHSNNASTAHDGMSMLRIGGKYWENEGPTVADVDDCFSISIGCEVYDMLPTNGVKAGFQFYDGDSTVHNDKYVIDCLVDGKNIEWGITGTDNTYVMGLEGNTSLNGDIKEIDWESV